jgi:hypothetical protein
MPTVDGPRDGVEYLLQQAILRGHTARFTEAQERAAHRTSQRGPGKKPR